MFDELRELKEFYNQFEKSITPSILLSDIKIGFELEGFVIQNDKVKDLESAYNYVKENYIKCFYGEEKIRDDSLKNQVIVKDEDLESPYGYFKFELNSVPFNCSPHNIKLLEEYLLQLNEKNIMANKKCSFHIHFSFPSLSFKYFYWFLLLYTHNKIFIKYRNNLFFPKKMKCTIKINNENFYFRNRNMEINLREKTFEWRLPRGFIGNEDLTKQFIKELRKFCVLIKKSNNINEVEADKKITKQEFFQKEYKECFLKYYEISISNNSIFDITYNCNIFWKNGTWREGIWRGGIWEYGIWKNGIWKNGTWREGIWIDGIWEKGIWIDGTWEKGIWIDGTWKGGYIFSKKLNKYIFSKIDPDGFYGIERSCENENELKKKVA